MVSEKETVEKRDVYAPPCVVKISDLKQGAGICHPGSGDSGCCWTNGNNASDICSANGNGVYCNTV
jgi:hypothetical protein